MARNRSGSWVSMLFVWALLLRFRAQFWYPRGDCYQYPHPRRPPCPQGGEGLELLTTVPRWCPQGVDPTIALARVALVETMMCQV